MFTPALVLATVLAAHDGNSALQSLEDKERTLREKLAAHERSQPDSTRPEFEAWDAKHLQLQWDAGYALYRLALEKKDRKLLRRVVDYFTDFIWKREFYLAAFHARLILAHTHQVLREWPECYRHLRGARLTHDPEYRKNPEIVELATRSYIAEFRARTELGEKMEPALAGAREHLKEFGSKSDSPLFAVLLLEMSREYNRSKKRDEASKILRAVWAAHGKSDLGERALKLLVEIDELPEHIEMLADRYYDKAYFTSAVVLYRRLPARPRTWLRLGACYKNLRRFSEAIFVLKRARAGEESVRMEAALLLERVLNHVVKKLRDATYRGELETHRKWMRDHFDFSKAGPGAIKLMADSLMTEGKFSDALALYERILPGQDGYADALHSRGYCRFKLKEYEKSAKAFRAYLELGDGSPSSIDAALDLACWSLLKLDRPEEVLALTDERVPKEGRFIQWRLAHRIDALARLGRFPEARKLLGTMNEEVAFSPKVRALERLALGYEGAIRRTGEKKLWGSYARVVVELSEKTHRPLLGEKLLAAADALSLEETPGAFRMAFDLYTQYLADRSVPDKERRDVEYRLARAAMGSGNLKNARDIVLKLVEKAPNNGSYSEFLGDISSARAESLPRGSARNLALKDALDRYGRLSAAWKTAKGEHYYRLLHKWLSIQFRLDPEKAAVFFLAKERAGWGEWDEDQWGYRTKMKDLRKRIFKIVPEGRLRR